jgi:myo-inositol-1(or 4)-monophosphatase
MIYHPMNIQALRLLKDQTQLIVDDAAAFIRTHFGQVSTHDIEVKGHNSLVSYVDKTSEEILVAGLQKILPSAGFITEEETTSQEQKEYTWIIDPLDGTTNFLHGIPHFSISIGLYDGKNVILGIVHNVMTSETYWAIKGDGAYVNNRPIMVTQELHFASTLIGTGFPYKQNQTVSGHFTALEEILHTTRGIRRFGSAALDLCYVATGHFGAFYEHTLNAYDIAGGALIVTEAGGKISDYSGGSNWLFEGQILAAAPQFKGRMVEILRQF